MQDLRFARIVYALAAVYGILMLPPLYFLIDAIGRANPPAVTHPEFYYGFVGVAVLWQLVFYLIARDPVRLRPIMPITILEKLVYVVPVAILFLHGRTSLNTLIPTLGDPIFCVLFIVAYVKTPSAPQRRGHLE
jgi:hypothetical protein